MSDGPLPFQSAALPSWIFLIGSPPDAWSHWSEPDSVAVLLPKFVVVVRMVARRFYPDDVAPLPVGWEITLSAAAEDALPRLPR